MGLAALASDLRKCAAGGILGLLLLPAAAQAAVARVEAQSADLFAVGVVDADHMVIRLSRRVDNAPLHDAAVNVVLRGATYPTTAQADGSYLLQAPDLTLPGAAAVQFQVVQSTGSESLEGTLGSGAPAVAVPGPDREKNGSRQLWWWALNFGVCIGFLWLWSKRKKPAEDEV